MIVVLTFTTDRPLNQGTDGTFWPEGLRYVLRGQTEGPRYMLRPRPGQYEYTADVVAAELLDAAGMAALRVADIAARHGATATITAVRGAG
jgi:hypothetical protein